MRRMSFVFALIAVLGFGSLFIEPASAQNSNSSTTAMSGQRHARGRRWHRKQRRHRRHKMKHNMTMSPKNANQ
jgi:hypothetical protein